MHNQDVVGYTHSTPLPYLDANYMQLGQLHPIFFTGSSILADFRLILKACSRCTPATDIIRRRRLQLFGHIATSEPEMDHRRALRAAVQGPPADWKRPRGRPRQTWTRTVENNLKHANFGLHTAWLRAQDRADWRNFVSTASSNRGMLLMTLR